MTRGDQLMAEGILELKPTHLHVQTIAITSIL